MPKKIPKFNQEIMSRLKGYVFQKIGNQQEAEEIFQDVLVSATDCLSFYKGESSFFTWVCGIANHKIVDFYRKKKIKTILFSHFPFLENLATEALLPDEKMEKEELRKEVKKILASLTEGYQEILRLKYVEELTIKQIAKKLKTSFKSIESRLFRARQAFKRNWLARE